MKSWRRFALVAFVLGSACEGPAGPMGPPGPAGPAGNPGPALPTGATLRGTFGHAFTATAAGQFAATAVGFGFVLSAAPTAHFITSGAVPPTGCPGTAANPQANAGHLCVYESNVGNATGQGVCDQSTCPGSTPVGFHVIFGSVAAGTSFSRGAWAVTAP